jgi:LPXTG-motif cell wall-anchored protein
MTSNRTNRSRRTARLVAAPALAVTGLLAFAGAGASAASAVAVDDAAMSAGGITPTTLEGNPTCTDVGGATWSEAKLDFDPAAGDYTVNGLHVTITKAGAAVGWTSDADVAAVIMKGGPTANVYLYPGPADKADSGLVTPLNPNGNDDTKRYGISHVTFCVAPAAPEEESETPEEPKTPETPKTPDTPATPETPAPAAPVVEAAAAPAEPAVLAAAEVRPTEVLGVTLTREVAAAPAELPRTGVETGLLAAIGVALMAGGGIVLALAGRPRTTTTD